MRSLDTIYSLCKDKKIFEKFNLSNHDIETIKKILDIEWIMFDKVNEKKARAYCQDNSLEFFIMRFSQYLIYSSLAREKILSDFEDASIKNKNLVLEKYMRMMQYTDFKVYQENIKDSLEYISPIKEEAVNDIIEIIAKLYNLTIDKLPVTINHSRPSQTDDKKISSILYYKCELLTYSYGSLRQIYKDLSENKINLVEEIYINSIIINKELSQ